MANGPTPTEARHLRTLFSVGAAGTLTDGQLLERFATHDGDRSELAFAALVERHGSMVLRVARAVLVDEHSAHDTFQATFLILARKARALWVRDSLGPWLHAVASRVASHSRTLEGRRKHHERNASRIEAFEPRERDRNDLARAIHEEVERLPQPYRLAVVTCHLEGLTQFEAASRLGWPVGTLQSRLARGRQKLRDRLRRRGFAPSIAILAGKLAPVPGPLTAATAKAAASMLHLGGPTAGMIAPTVLAMIETTTKGMLMTKLKLGALGLLIACGIVGSGVGLGVGRPAKATDDESKSGQVKTGRVDLPAVPGPASNRTIASGDPDGDAKPDMVNLQSNSNEPIPPPADGPGFPYLLEFYYPESVIGLKLHQEVVDLARHGYPIKPIDVTLFGNGVSPGRAVADRYRVHSYPQILLVDGKGDEIDRIAEISTPAKIAAFYNANRSRSPNRAGHVDPASVVVPIGDDEPGLASPRAPKPWETVVRIKVHFSEKEWGFGSGTIISSTPEESIILTCAHTFRLTKAPGRARAQGYRSPISVDLFGGEFVGREPARLACVEMDVPGRAIDFDVTNNIALIRIRPGRKLPASKVVPPGWEPQRGAKMVTLGCSRGNDATAWDTTILDSRVTMKNSATMEDFATIKCMFQPKEGRSGGGLYTPDGQVAGVCLFADPNEHVGLYATPEAIRKLLDRNGLARLYRREGPGVVVAADGESDVEPSFTFPHETVVVPNEPPLVDEPPLPPAIMGVVVGEGPVLAPPREPTVDGRVSDQERRIGDLEGKLDRLLKALENLKGDKTPDLPKGGPPHVSS